MSTDTAAFLLELMPDMDMPAREEVARRLVAQSPRSRIRLAQAWWCPPAVLAELAATGTPAVRRAVAANASTPPASVRTLRDDADDRVRAAARGQVLPVTVPGRAAAVPVHDAATVAAVLQRLDTRPWTWYDAPPVDFAALAAEDPAWALDMKVLRKALRKAPPDRVRTALVPVFSLEAVVREAVGMLSNPMRDWFDRVMVTLVVEPLADGDDYAARAATMLAPHLDRLHEAHATLKAPTDPDILDAVCATDPVRLERLLLCEHWAQVMPVRDGRMTAAQVLAAVTHLVPFGDVRALEDELRVDLAALLRVDPQLGALMAAEHPVVVGLGLEDLLGEECAQQALAIAVASDDADLLLPAAEHDRLPASARLALAGHASAYVRDTILRRADVTGEDVIAAAMAGSRVSGRALERVPDADLARLPWRLARSERRVRAAVTDRLGALVLSAPHALDVVASLDAGFDGSVEEMLTAAAAL